MKARSTMRHNEISLWEHYDAVCLAASQLAKIAAALGLAESSEESLIIAEIMKMGDAGNGIFTIEDDRLPFIRTSGLIQIVFDWDATQMAIAPEFLFSLKPLDI